MVEGFIIGLHKSPYHGFSVEFAEHRLYNPGDSVRNIDWKVLARTDRLYVKRFEEETNLRCRLVIDTSSSMFYPDEKQIVNKAHFSALAAASLMYMFRRQRDAFGLSLFSDAVDVQSGMKSSMLHYQLMLSYLHGMLKGGPRKATAAASSLHQIAENTHKRSLVVIFSDMLDNISTEQGLEEIFSALQHLRYNKHEVILFHVMDKRHELDFAFDNRPYVFVDLETGEKVRVKSNRVREEYVKQAGHYREQIALKCAQFGVDYALADVRDDFSKVLSAYLVKRGRMQ